MDRHGGLRLNYGSVFLKLGGIRCDPGGVWLKARKSEGGPFVSKPVFRKRAIA